MGPGLVPREKRVEDLWPILEFGIYACWWRRRDPRLPRSSRRVPMSSGLGVSESYRFWDPVRLLVHARVESQSDGVYWGSFPRTGNETRFPLGWIARGSGTIEGGLLNAIGGTIAFIRMIWARCRAARVANPNTCGNGSFGSDSGRPLYFPCSSIDGESFGDRRSTSDGCK